MLRFSHLEEDKGETVAEFFSDFEGPQFSLNREGLVERIKEFKDEPFGRSEATRALTALVLHKEVSK